MVMKTRAHKNLLSDIEKFTSSLYDVPWWSNEGEIEDSWCVWGKNERTAGGPIYQSMEIPEALEKMAHDKEIFPLTIGAAILAGEIARRLSSDAAIEIAKTDPILNLQEEVMLWETRDQIDIITERCVVRDVKLMVAAIMCEDTEYREHLEARMRVWQKGYGLYSCCGDKFFVMRRAY